MKLVILADSISTQDSGIHYFGKQLVKRIISSYPQHSYHLITSARLHEFDVPQTIVPVNKFPLHLRYRQLISIPQIVKKLNPDLVLELAHFGPFGIPKKILRATVIHDLTPISHPQYHNELSYWMHKFLLPSILKKADLVISNSARTKSDLVAYYENISEKTSVIYPHIEIPQKASTKLSLPGKYILTVGTIEPRKNYDTLIKVFADLAKKDNELSLVIVGKRGWKLSQFDTLIKEHPYSDRIFITGYVDRSELWAYYQHANIFVFPSHYEGFGIPLLEAMYHKLPLVVSNIPTNHEIVSKAGMYFSSTNELEMKQSISKMLTDSNLKDSFAKKSNDRFKEIEKISDNQLSEFFVGLAKRIK